MLTRATFTHPHPAIGDHTDAHLVLTLHGENTPGATRPEVAVIPVVDTSGSMGAAGKLSLVTTALTHLSEHLAATDRLALVTFDSSVVTQVPLIRADAEGVGVFTRALAQLRPTTLTALAGGISAGLSQARQAPSQTLTRIVVLTDGRPNVGATDADELVDLVRSRPEHVSLSFLGVGGDCDHDLLGLLAEHGGGSYGFIETAADAPGVLGAEIGGILDAEAHNVTIRISTKDRYCTLNGPGPLGMAGERDADGALHVSLAQVLRGTSRHIVVPVTLHGAGKNHARPVTCATIEIAGSVDAEPISVQLRPKVKFLPEAGPVDTDLLEKVELAQVAQAISDARGHAAVGDYAAARQRFTGIALQSATAAQLRDSLAGSYDNAATYNTAAANLSSARAAAAGSLSGASAAFTSLASNTIGSLYSDGQRRLSAQTTRQSQQQHQDPQSQDQQIVATWGADVADAASSAHLTVGSCGTGWRGEVTGVDDDHPTGHPTGHSTGHPADDASPEHRVQRGEHEPRPDQLLGWAASLMASASSVNSGPVPSVTFSGLSSSHQTSQSTSQSTSQQVAYIAADERLHETGEARGEAPGESSGDEREGGHDQGEDGAAGAVVSP